MTDTALKNALFGADSASMVNPAMKAAAKAQNAAGQMTGKTQDFGAVLDRTAQKYEQTSAKQVQTAADSSTKSQTQQSEQAAAGPEKDTAVDEAVDEKVSDTQETAEEIAQEEPKAEEPVDEMTIDEIARALEQIIEQIKEILGITDEELLSGMEELGLQPYDLLNASNMSQLVTAISGEDSVISLVANEDLYAAVQDITKLVETQTESLLDQTGLTSGELDAVLQKLKEMEIVNAQEQVQEPEPKTLPYEPAVEQQAANEPVIIKEDNTKTDDQPAKQYDTLPENQQEELPETNAKPQAQNAGKDTKDSDSDKGTRSFGQDSTAQNFQNHLTEMSDMPVAEGIEKFTSQSTEDILRQLADMVKIIKNENLTEMELQLHPASLGTVNVSLTTKGGVVTAEFTTQNETVKAAIEAQASQLRANLEEQGVKVEAIEVSVESHQMERNLDKNGDQQQKQSQEQEAVRIRGMRRGSINLRAFADGEQLEGEMQGADDATRIAMEIMAANGNTMDLLV